MVQIRKFAHQGERIETGVVQFGEDWPGIFIRGDQAIGTAELLRTVAVKVPAPEAKILLGISKLLSSCKIND